MNHIETLKQALEALTASWSTEQEMWKVHEMHMNAITALRTAIEQMEKQETLTDSFVQQVPDKCDRIVWRGSYYHLPPAAQPAPVQEPDWSNVGRLVEAAHRANAAGHLTGTSNWAAAVFKYMSEA